MPSKTQSIIMGGLVAGLLSTSYLGIINLACCAGVIIGAMVGVWHYTNEHSLTIKPGQGAAIGALVGITAVIISTALDQALGLIGLPTAQELGQQMQQMFAGGELTPEQKEQIEAANQQFNTPMFKIIGMLIGAAVFSIFGAAGGAIGAAVFKKGGEEPEEVL